jgi:hypothetical protein
MPCPFLEDRRFKFANNGGTRGRIFKSGRDKKAMKNERIKSMVAKKTSKISNTESDVCVISWQSSNLSSRNLEASFSDMSALSTER